MYYTVYKITDKINGKIYIGKHQTKKLDDGYMGSGKYLTRAIGKHGIENFQKDLLFVFDTELEMDAKEKELVTEEFCLRSDTYNLCVGGQGGFSYINRTRDHHAHSQAAANNRDYSLTDWSCNADPSKTKATSDRNKELAKKGVFDNFSFKGRKHTDAKKQKHSDFMSGRNTGSNHPQFGKTWITDGQQNKIIKSVDCIPEGWYKGRVMK